MLVLKAFQHEEWPLKSNSNSNPPHEKNSNGSSSSSSSSSPTHALDNAVRAAEQAALRHSSHGTTTTKPATTTNAAIPTTGPDENEETVDDSPETEETGTVTTADETDGEASGGPTSPETEDSTTSPGKHAAQPTEASLSSDERLPVPLSSTTNNTPLEDDPQTREPIHPAIVATLEAFMLVLQDPAKQPKPIEFALDGVALIVAHCYLSGRAGGQYETETPSLLNRLVESVAKSSDSTNDAVQTAVVATMTAIMTSPKCSVHETAMLTAMRSTFHVYLVTKSTTGKASAKRALLNMLKSVLFRMEAYDAMSRSNNNNSSNGNRSVGANDGESIASEESPDSKQCGTEIVNSPAPSSSSSSFASQYHTDAYNLIRSLCKISSKELPADTTDETALKAKHAGILMFTAMPTDPTDLNSKILSLELILAAMEYCGEAFTNSDKFVYLVQHYLCGSLLKNCVSTHTHVAFLSQKIFLVLVRARMLHFQ